MNCPHSRHRINWGKTYAKEMTSKKWRGFPTLSPNTTHFPFVRKGRSCPVEGVLLKFQR
jgi:hypothetical protein